MVAGKLVRKINAMEMRNMIGVTLLDKVENSGIRIVLRIELTNFLSKWVSR